MIDRRRFLKAGASMAGVAAAAGVGGQILTNKRFNVSTSRNAVKLNTPAFQTPKLRPGTEITDIPGLTPFYTSNANFYRVDTALVIPQVTTQQWALRIHGMVDKPMTINFQDLLRLPQLERDMTLCCVSEQVGGVLTGNAQWQGTPFADLLRKTGVQKGATQIVMRDVNGMNLGVSVDAVLDGRHSLLAYGMNGVALPPEHGFPVRVVIPGLYGYVSACKWVVDMEVTTYQAFSAYWTHRGWSAQAEIKTESRIDVPKTNATVKAGTVTVAGIAWAQTKGVAAVEVGVDGVFHQATLATKDTFDTWRQWYYHWNATPGTHTIQVRATDNTGYTQTQKKHGAEPNGATGWHTIKVKVA